MNFTVRGDSIPNNGSGCVNIVDIGNTNGNALICWSEIVTSEEGDWFLHPIEMSTDVDDRIVSKPDRGWTVTRAVDSKGHRLVRLIRRSDFAEEGVFTCDFPADGDTTRHVGVYHPSEFYHYYYRKCIKLFCHNIILNKVVLYPSKH